MIYIFLAMLLYTTAMMIGVVAARNGNTNVISAIVNTVSAIVPVAVVIPVVQKKEFLTNKVGLIAALLSGAAIALYVMALTKGFSQNNVAIVAPIVFGGAIFLSAILSYIFFKEKILLMQGIGLLLLVAGLALIIYSKAYGK